MQEDLSLDTLLQRSSEPLQAGLDDEVVMMSIEKGSYYGLDPVGACIWELLEEPKTVKELVDVLLERYDVNRSTCEADTLTFLETLRREELVVVHAGK